MHLLSVRAKISKRPPARAQGRLHGAAPARELAGAGWLHAGPWPLFSKALNHRPQGRVPSQGCSAARRWVTGGLCWAGVIQAFPEQSWTPLSSPALLLSASLAGSTPHGAVLRCSMSILLVKLWLREPVRTEAWRALQKFRHNSKEITSLLSVPRQQALWMCSRQHGDNTFYKLYSKHTEMMDKCLGRTAAPTFHSGWSRW